MAFKNKDSEELKQTEKELENQIEGNKTDTQTASGRCL